MNAHTPTLVQPDKTAMRSHVEHLFGGYLDGYHDGKIELAYTSGGPKPDHAFWFGTDQLDELVDKAAELNANPLTNVYIGAALRHPDCAPFGRSKDKDAWALTALYVDLDDPGAAQAAKDIYGTNKPTMVVVTGSEPHVRAQMWWRLEEPTTDTDAWPAQLRGLAGAMKGDSSVTNPGRIMRLAGTIAWPVKEGRTKVELTTIAKLKEPGPTVYHPAVLGHAFPPLTGGASSEVDTTGVTRSTNGLGLPALISDGREKYMRDTALAVLIEYMGTTGAVPTPQELFDEAWPQYERQVDLSRPGRGPKEFAEKCKHTIQRFERGEIRGVLTIDDAIAIYQRKAQAPRIEQARAEEAKAEGPSGRLLITGAEFISTFTPPEYLIDGMIQRGYLYSLTARTGHGKTAVSMFIMQAIARGIKIHTKDTQQGSVLFCAGENPSDIQARYLVLCDKMGFDPASAPIYFINGVVDIEASLPRIQEEAALIPNLKLVVVDTAAAYFKGDDGNSNAQQGAFARVLRQLSFLPGKPTVLVPCHPVKNASKDNLLPMGGSSFLNEVDGNLTLWADGDQTTMHTQGKFRGPEFDPVTFKMETVTSDLVKDSRGRHMPSVIAKPIGEMEIEMGINDAETDENVLLSIIANNRPLSVGELAKRACWLTPAGAPYKSKVFRVTERLVEDKLIVRRRGRRFAATPAGRKEIGLDDE